MKIVSGRIGYSNLTVSKFDERRRSCVRACTGGDADEDFPSNERPVKNEPFSML